MEELTSYQIITTLCLALHLEMSLKSEKKKIFHILKLISWISYPQHLQLWDCWKRNSVFTMDNSTCRILYCALIRTKIVFNMPLLKLGSSFGLIIKLEEPNL